MILEKQLKGTRAKRPVIIFLHGFGRKRTGELEAFQKAFENDYEIIMPELFDPEDAKDSNGILWANRALHVVEKELLKQRRVILGGFSMGGVIASWIASMLPVEKLILAAPAFDLINLKNTGNILASLITHFTHLESPQEIANFNGLPANFFQTLIDIVVQFRPYASRLSCPVLLIHGSQDGIVSPQSSKIAFSRMPSVQKQMFVIENGHHVLFEDKGVCPEVLALIQLYLNDQIVIRNEEILEEQPAQEEKAE